MTNKSLMKIEPSENKPTDEQREFLIELIAAGYTNAYIRNAFAKRGWPVPKRSNMDYHRNTYGKMISTVQNIRWGEAINSGLAIKEEMIRRLQEHADELHARMWEKDRSGHTPNEKAWRETLDQIAVLMGYKKLHGDTNVGVVLIWDGMNPSESNGQK